jgi:hypothetical protein
MLNVDVVASDKYKKSHAVAYMQTSRHTTQNYTQIELYHEALKMFKKQYLNSRIMTFWMLKQAFTLASILWE